MIELKTLEDYVQESVDATRTARFTSEKARRYRDNDQLTAGEKKILTARNQPTVVINRIGPKADFVCGMELKTRTDPKAFPRTPKHDEGADAVTDAIRFALDRNEFDQIASDVFENIFVEGIGGVSVEAELKGDDIEVALRRFRWDQFFYDPHSMDRFFRDASYDGIVVWKDLAEAKERWGDKAEDLQQSFNTLAIADTGYDDKPQMLWYNKTRERVMCIDMCFKWQGVWHQVIFAKGVMLEEPKPSAYVDEYGIPQNKFIAVSDKVKQEGERYGHVEGMMDRQDVVNKSHSKAMHILNQERTFSKKGMLQGKLLKMFKKNMADPQGHVEFPQTGEFNKDFGVIPAKQMAGPIFDMYLDAKGDLEVTGANAALTGATDRTLSGKALDRLQSGGQIELGPLFNTHSFWKKMVYRAVWNIQRQFWREEKWIRVTDNEENLRFVGLNVPFSVAEQMVMDETGLKLSQVREQYAQELAQVHAQLPELAQLAAVENEVVEMDVDIILEEVPDVINLQAEQFDQLVTLFTAAPDHMKESMFENIIRMSSLRNKDQVLGKDDDPERQQAVAQQKQQQDVLLALDAEGKQADTAVKKATAMEKFQKAQQTSVETDMIINNPDPQPQAII